MVFSSTAMSGSERQENKSNSGLKYERRAVTSRRERERDRDHRSLLRSIHSPQIQYGVHPHAHVTPFALPRPPMEPKRSSEVDPELLITPRPTKSPAKRLFKCLVSLGLLWYILHRWLFLLAFNATAHDPYSWAVDAFAPKQNGLTNSQLAENFFLCALLFYSYRCH
jgi:hypothetical protein